MGVFHATFRTDFLILWEDVLPFLMEKLSCELFLFANLWTTIFPHFWAFLVLGGICGDLSSWQWEILLSGTASANQHLQEQH